MTNVQHSTISKGKALKKAGNSQRFSWYSIFAAILVVSALGSADCMASTNAEEENIRVTELNSNTELSSYGDPIIWDLEKLLEVDLDGDGIIGYPLFHIFVIH